LEFRPENFDLTWGAAQLVGNSWTCCWIWPNVAGVCGIGRNVNLNTSPVHWLTWDYVILSTPIRTLFYIHIKRVIN